MGGIVIHHSFKILFIIFKGQNISRLSTFVYFVVVVVAVVWIKKVSSKKGLKTTQP